MEIIDQHTKKIMEGCKERAHDAGLHFDNESMEYIVTNRDLVELTTKGMIPTLYDYWVHDLEVIRGKREYELYPHNPYETVINSRPPLSFYNDNNPDWLNVMIFYHVIGHIDFMQSNNYFRHTWDDDFVGQALADKRLINDLRTKYGRWVDYVIEFSRGIDNLVGYYQELADYNRETKRGKPNRLNYYFDVFLQKVLNVETPDYLKELERYNQMKKDAVAEDADSTFIASIKIQYPEFEAHYDKYCEDLKPEPRDLLQYLMRHSDFLNRDENNWMKSVMEIVRNTSLFFAPQMRTKILNEGWATYWHYELFLRDDRISGHEVDFAKINALVTAVPKIGLNPYAIGWRLFEYIESQAGKGRLTYEYERLLDVQERKRFDRQTGEGRDFIFKVRKHYNDFNFINSFIDQDFVDHYKLVVIGERINQQRMTREYYIKSKKAGDYRDLILNQLIHPPHITVDHEASRKGVLQIEHHFEGKQLIPEFIDNVMIGMEFLWGGEVRLKTHILRKGNAHAITYIVKNRKVTRQDGHA